MNLFRILIVSVKTVKLMFEKGEEFNKTIRRKTSCKTIKKQKEN